MKKAIRYALPAAFVSVLTVSAVPAANAQPATLVVREGGVPVGAAALNISPPADQGVNTRSVPIGLAPNNDTQKVGNGDHGNNNSNGG